MTEMKELELDLTKNATRKYILDLLLEKLADEERAAHVSAIRLAGLPEGHFDDLGDVEESVKRANLSDAVKAEVCDIYRILSDAEAKVHGGTSDVHFHEIGNAEAVRNVVAICTAVEMLGIEKLTFSPAQTGSGQVTCEHGTFDIPAPATAAIIEQGIPVCEEKLEGELMTPTSAAVILHYLKRG